MKKKLYRKSFKSPRECYKHMSARIKSLSSAKFQVPKGMLQTILQQNAMDRDCRFQVPKGMLQTVFVSSNSVLVAWFQVPKGMLQTEKVERYEFNVIYGFKSPRECYKLSKDFLTII